MQTILRSTNVLVDDAFIRADIVIQGDKITAIKPYQSVDVAIDLGDRRVVAGFVDLHGDAIEKEIEPRPGARFPTVMAVVELDKKLSMSGITTMFHAIGFNDEELRKGRGTEQSKSLIHEIYEANREHLGVDNLIHARFEITSESSISTVKSLIKERKINMLSIMDHSPGQGQFKTLEAWKNYFLKTYTINEEEVEQYLADKNAKDKNSIVQDLVTFAINHHLPVLSHDDDCLEKLTVLKALGVTFSEFPLSHDVAKNAKEMGIKTGMGAPNVVRGGSQSGNIAARELIQEGVCDYLCSDYHPASMLLSPYRLKEDIGLPLEKGFAMISQTPAALAGLSDRGELKEGLLADIVVIDESHFPKVVLTFKEGEIVYNGIRGFSL
ncbi:MULTISPECIES: alpha-D-ribose 1-methylphosphonate 5-triphosphate diphosphatase [unclassified Sulfurospirillum]|uniref:alpha-D-ribose 1-methylphosphonate 5-triphosphate diphosphatase n=1 Tax=unclassified Sulfurospirillum TaxID=2618290 RepID=UPI0005044303|nr:MULTISPECIES: alpha-D-ribose 1-methylphosphonate 5-triphosphate diphosphatase [unclassified Sulfurospirillum]KFL35193.1 amidohydrolase [Sulfurospirillum sp. SCADC]